MDSKNNSGIFLVLVSIITVMSSCYQNEHLVVFSSDEITRLISGDTVKSWETVKLVIDGSEQTGDACSINLIEKFSYSKDDQITHLYEIYKNPGVCNGADTLIESGEWYVMEGSQGAGTIDTLALILSGDTLRFGIKEITSTRMKLSGNVNNSLTEEDLEWYNP